MRRPAVVLSGLTAATISAVLAVSAFGATKTIALKDDQFAPKTVTVTKGSTVRWVWKGKAPHNVTVVSGPVKFSSKTQTKGSFSKMLMKKGVYKIVCTIHPGMNLTLKVK
ncbi:MAG TPA: plastocyanin/azurin family copper-binding protein [Solirubrobacteraceae bacterium]|jgi:plastocyanin|nr:plastocyanin/azurin family copper-binding protein [Solirubrobacteraceae bacterium]